MLATILWASFLAIPDLTTEVRVNSHVGGVCGPACPQAEPSIAVAGDTMVIGFNDTRYPGAVSGYAYSTDGGATWTEARCPWPAMATRPSVKSGLP